jgi:uncharacterized protein
MVIYREISAAVRRLLSQFAVLTITGPRQSGKTTLVRELFPDMPYVSLEDPDIRQVAIRDPRGFLSNYSGGGVLDEVQHVPDLFSYIQTLVDSNRGARFILTGSSNFLLLEHVGQTLAGRSAILKLLPFSISELKAGGFPVPDYETLIHTGQYPRIYDRGIPAADFYPSYIQTYVERDVRAQKNIGDLNSFIQFVQLCAGRLGQLVNYAGLAADAGISPNTAKAWISILEASYIVYRLQPYHRNFSKRIVKSPKLYFHDTGVACSLLGIESKDQVTTHYLRGALFENLVINEFLKHKFNQGKKSSFYFWRDSREHEIDCLDAGREILQPFEIKSGRTITDAYFTNLQYWRKLAGVPREVGAVVYGGDQSMQISGGDLVSWRDLDQLLKGI